MFKHFIDWIRKFWENNYSLLLRPLMIRFGISGKYRTEPNWTEYRIIPNRFGIRFGLPLMKILHGGLIITYLKNFIFDDDCIACQKHGKHGDKKILIDSVLCLSINGLWIAFHWRRTWLPPQHSFFAHVKIGMCESNVYSSINQYYLIEYI